MNRTTIRRLEQIEQIIHVELRSPAELAEERYRRGAAISLSDGELQALIDYTRALQDDLNAQPTHEQQEAICIFERRFQEFKATGKLEVNGRLIEVNLR